MNDKQKKQQQRMAQINKLAEQISAMDNTWYDMDRAWERANRAWDWAELPALEKLEQDRDNLIWQRDDLMEEYAQNSDNPDLHRFEHIRDRERNARRYGDI